MSTSFSCGQSVELVRDLPLILFGWINDADEEPCRLDEKISSGAIGVVRRVAEHGMVAVQFGSRTVWSASEFLEETK